MKRVTCFFSETPCKAFDIVIVYGLIKFLIR